MKVFIAQEIDPVGEKYLEERGYELVRGTASDEETICREAADCEGMIVRTAKVTRKIMNAIPNLKAVSRHGVGVDAIDVSAATELGIQVTNGPLSNYESVAEHTVTLLMACAHHIVQMDHAVRNGDWDARNRVRLTEMTGKTVGIIGLGRIGRAVAQRLALGMNMKIIGFDAYVNAETLPDYIELKKDAKEVYQQADFVSLHCPATEETKGSVNKECFDLMKESAFLINCARGEVVNEEDLIQALQEHKIAGAGLDVLSLEPPKADNPLFDMDNVILSPHCGAHSRETFQKMALHAAMGVDEVLSGKEVSWSVNKLK